jgi:hypothetical protein
MSSVAVPTPFLCQKNTPFPYDSACKTWRASRFEPIILDVPIAVLPVQNPKPARAKNPKSAPKSSARGKKNGPAEKARRLLKFAAVLAAVLRLMREQARKRSEEAQMRKQGKKAKENANVEAPAVRERKKPPRGEHPMNRKSAKAGKNEADRRQKTANQQKKSRNLRIGISSGRSAGEGQSGGLRTARIPTRLKATFPPLAAQSRKPVCLPMAAKTRKKEKPPAVYLYEMLGLFAKKRKRRRLPSRA